jgi:hypothetical protein
LRAGKPDYDRMSPTMAFITRLQLSDFQGAIKGFGAVKSITFKGVGPGGADIYDVVFDNHATQWRLLLGADGKSEAIGFTVPP